jgi:poly(3-hydroxyalkanoate) depolymerase
VNTQTIHIDGRAVRVGSMGLKPGAIPVLLFNGIGANIELCRPLSDELATLGVGTIIFDVPGVGESDSPLVPYRFSDIARLATRVLDVFGIDGKVDVAGVSWGGALAQQFAYQYSDRTRKLILCATSAGSLSFPGKFSALIKLANPRRYVDKNYMRKIGGSLYGGAFRRRPDLLGMHAQHMKPPKGPGYFYQMAAGIGWTSAGWAHTLKCPTLVMMGTDDPIMPVANGKILASLIPGARLFTIDDGHLFLITRVKDVAPLLAGFLAEAMPATVARIPTKQRFLKIAS